MKKLSLGLAALAMSASALAPAAASAQRYDERGYYGDRYEHVYNQAYRDGYNQPPRYYDRGEYRRRCDSGSTGTIVGAIAGGLLGSSVAGRGDHLLGALVGGGAGALAGRAIDRSGNRYRC